MNIAFLFFVYYLALPIIAISFLYLIYKEKKVLHYFYDMRNFDRNKRLKSIKAGISNLDRLKTFFVIVMVLFLPLWSFTASEYCDYGVHREIQGGTGVKGPAYAPADPVISSLGPSYDHQSIIDRMEEKPYKWLPDEVRKDVDLEGLTRYPGRLAVYLISKGRYILTYTYLSPFPIIRAYGFFISDPGGEDPSLLLMSKKTVVYPMSPDEASKIFI